MFERIPLLYGGHEVSHRDILEKTRQITQFEALDGDALAAARAQANSRFLIDGEIRLLFPFSTTERERACYFYPQLFCYMDSSEKYFTRRKDYDSYEILYTYAGRGELRYGGRTYALAAGDGVLITSHLSHGFRRQCGMAPIEYLLRVRVENARRMLALTDRPIYEIAERMGFSDVNNFTRQFKKQTGMTPRDYRRGLAGRDGQVHR